MEAFQSKLTVRENRGTSRSHGCDFPLEVLDRPVLTKACCVTEGTSLMIDKSVREILKEAVSVYEIHVDSLKSLKPDVIVTQTKCEICAVSLKDVESALKDLFSYDVTLVDLHANTIEDIYSDIGKVATALELKDKGYQLVEKIKKRISCLSEEVRFEKPPTVVCLGWIEPLMSSGNWIPELVTKSKAKEVLAKRGEDSYTFSFERLMELDPEYLIVMPCGFSLSRTRDEMRDLTKNKGFKELQCVKKNQVFLTDGHSYFNRPSPRITDSLEILIDIFHRKKSFKEGMFSRANLRALS